MVEASVRERRAELRAQVLAGLEPPDVRLVERLSLRAVDAVVVVREDLPLRLEPRAGGIVVPHQHRVECAADHVERRLRVVAVSGHVTEHHEALAALPPRVRKRRLERLRIRVDVAHDGELHAALTSRRTASAG